MSRFVSAASQGADGSSNTGSNVSPFLDRDEAKQKLEQTQRQWSKTHDELNELIRARSTTPHMSPVEIDAKDRQILDLQFRLSTVEQLMADYQRQLKAAETTILQQQVTIRNQSKAIENPRPNREGPLTPVYPRHPYQPEGLRQNFAGTPTKMAYSGTQIMRPQIGPAYGNPPQVQATSTFVPPNPNIGANFDHQRSTHTSRSVTRNTFSSVNDFGSPEQVGPGAIGRPMCATRPGPSAAPVVKYKAGNISNPPKSFQSLPKRVDFKPIVAVPKPTQYIQSPESTVSSNPYPESSIPSSQTTCFGNESSTSNEAEIRELFQKVFDMTVQYARIHVNFPSTAGDNALPQDTKDRLMKAATASTAFGLMSNSATRYFLIAKVIIQWMIKYVFKHSTFAGLDVEIDQVLEATRATIYQSTPPHIKFLLLNNMSVEVKKIREKPNFPDFIKYLSEQRANQLWLFVRPLMHQKTTNDWEDLIPLMQELHKLVELVYTGTDEYRIDFPDIGSSFNKFTMINVDPTCQHYTYDQLRHCRADVRLSATPIVNIRRNATHGPISSGVVYKSLVLLKFPR